MLDLLFRRWAQVEIKIATVAWSTSSASADLLSRSPSLRR